MQIAQKRRDIAVANRVLIIGSDFTDSKFLSDPLEASGWKIEKTKSAQDAKKKIANEDLDPHMICIEVTGDKEKNLETIRSIDKKIDSIEWIIFTDKEDIIEDNELDQLSITFIEKPYTKKKVEVAIRRAIKASLTSRRLFNYTSHQSYENTVDAYIGNSPEVVELKTMLKELSAVPISTMIVTGETGTGKGLVARILHNSGMRKNGPLVELNCAALPRDLLESHLFGHEAGAFTGAKQRYRGLFEQADGGTLFLDEIGDMHIDLQAKVLKAIEDKRIRRLGSEREIEVDVQIIAATAQDLEEAYKKKKFREDLYHRLSVFCVTLPPLRERKKDLAELVPRVIAEFNAVAGKHVETVSDEVWERLLSYDWPGNVRELRNVIERCVLMAKGTELPSDWLQLKSTCAPEEDNVTRLNGDTVRLPIDGSMALDEMDGFIIQRALEENDYNITETARILKTTRETIRYRIQKYSLKTSA